MKRIFVHTMVHSKDTLTTRLCSFICATESLTAGSSFFLLLQPGIWNESLFNPDIFLISWFHWSLQWQSSPADLLSLSKCLVGQSLQESWAQQSDSRLWSCLWPDSKENKLFKLNISQKQKDELYFRTKLVKSPLLTGWMVLAYFFFQRWNCSS